MEPGSDTRHLIEDLCSYTTGVVADDNVMLFERISKELPLHMHEFRSGEELNGWVIPDNWRVERATVSRDGNVLFDGTQNALGVGRYSNSFSGSLELEELMTHVSTHQRFPHAHVFHCMWQYRPWDADWALSIPYETVRTLSPGTYDVDLVTEREPGTMLVGEYVHPGRSAEAIVFNAHTCHPHMANDGFAGVALLIRLFDWLSQRETNYTYRLLLGPEHLGTVFYLRDRSREEMARLVSGIFAEMPGTQGPIKATSTFLGGQDIDRAVATVLAHHAKAYQLAPWRKGAGNDETVWEAPGYEVPFVEMTRSEDFITPFAEYHTDLDGPELMDDGQLLEFYEVLENIVIALEENVTARRRFDGLISLSNPRYDLYMERPDPSVDKELAEDSETWGYLLDCILRYFDGSISAVEIAEKHGVSFNDVRAYLALFEAKGLVDLEFAPIQRPRISER